MTINLSPIYHIKKPFKAIKLWWKNKDSFEKHMIETLLCLFLMISIPTALIITIMIKLI